MSENRKTYTATTPNGEDTATSERTKKAYTHAAVLVWADGRQGIIGFHVRKDLAEKNSNGRAIIKNAKHSGRPAPSLIAVEAIPVEA